MNKIACLLSLGMATCAFAADREDKDCRHEDDPQRRHLPTQVSAPEIDPNVATGALVLLATGTLILTDRYRRARRSV